jgi:hypothetical protein
MAYSSSSLDDRNIFGKNITPNLNASDLSRHSVNLGKILQWKKECIEQPTTAEPKRIVNNLKVQRERKKHRYKNELKNNPEKKQDKLNQEEGFNYSNNQHCLFEEFVYHSNILAQPNEVLLTSAD